MTQKTQPPSRLADQANYLQGVANYFENLAHTADELADGAYSGAEAERLQAWLDFEVQQAWQQLRTCGHQQVEAV